MIFEKFSNWLVSKGLSRQHDFTIGPVDNPYLLRWYLIPRNKILNIYLHKILRSDDDRALHDHPWLNLSVILTCGYYECVATRGATTRLLWRKPGSLVLRSPRKAHRLIVRVLPTHPDYTPTWSLFITGPTVRLWGFWCPRGWVPWQDFVDSSDKGNVGKGCAE